MPGPSLPFSPSPSRLSLQPHPGLLAGLCTLQTCPTSGLNTRSPSTEPPPRCSSIPSMLCSKSLPGMSRWTTLFKTATVLPAPTLHPLPQCIPHNSCLLKNQLKEARSVHQASYKTKTWSHLEPRKCLWPLNIKEGI